MTFALFLLYVALSYIHPGQIAPALAPYRITYWVGIAGLAVASVSLLNRRIGVLVNFQFWALLVFTAVMCASLMIAERWLGAPLLAIQRFGPSLTIFVLALCSVTSLRRLRIASGFVIVLTLLLTLQGAAAYHFGYNAQLFLTQRATTSDEAVFEIDEALAGLADVAQGDGYPSEDSQWRPPRIRALGSMNDPNDLALGMIVAMGLIAGVWKPRPRPGNLLLGAAAIALVYGVYLTRSRGGAVALVILLWRVAASRLGRVPALALLVTLGAGLLAIDLGGRSVSVDLDESAAERLVAWTEGFEMLKASPILGVGYGQFVEHHPLTAHNSLVLCLAETGLLGCFFWVSLFVVTALELRWMARLAGDDPRDALARHWAEGLQFALVGFIVAAFFLSRTFVPMLYLLIGLAAALATIMRAEGKSVPLPALPVLGLIVLACEIGGIGIVYSLVKLRLA